jgi:sodium transport system permease protein
MITKAPLIRRSAMVTRRAWRQAAVVLVKEFIDSARDRRALASVLLTVLIGPVITGFMMNRIADRQRAAEEVRIPIVGAQNAPALVEWLRQQSGVEIAPAPEAPEQAVKDQSEYVVAIIPPDFAERFRASKPATIKLVADSARADTYPQVDRVRRLFEQYNAQIGSLRLVGRGVSPAVATPVLVQEVEVSTTQQRAARLLAVIPLMILLAAFTGAMQIATDATAGERERGSLEALLINPVPRSALAVGKTLAAALTAMLAVGLTAGICAALLRFVPLQEMGMRFRFGMPHFLGMMAAVLPMCLVTAAFQVCVATMARSFKEAQTYMGILILAPMLTGVLGTLYPIDNQPWMYGMPILGQYVLLTNVLGGRTPNPLAFLAAAAACVVAATLLVRLTVALLRDERIIFGR